MNQAVSTTQQFSGSAGAVQVSNASLSLLEERTSDECKKRMLSQNFYNMPKEEQHKLALALMGSFENEGRVSEAFAVTTSERVVVVSSAGASNSQKPFIASFDKNSVEIAETPQDGFSEIDIEKGLYSDFYYSGAARRYEAGNIAVILHGVFNSVEDQISSDISDKIYNTALSFEAVGLKPRSDQRVSSFVESSVGASPECSVI